MNKISLKNKYTLFEFHPCVNNFEPQEELWLFFLVGVDAILQHELYKGYNFVGESLPVFTVFAIVLKPFNISSFLKQSN